MGIVEDYDHLAFLTVVARVKQSFARVLPVDERRSSISRSPLSRTSTHPERVNDAANLEQFLVVDTRFYERLRPSVRWSVSPFVGLSRSN